MGNQLDSVSEPPFDAAADIDYPDNLIVFDGRSGQRPVNTGPYRTRSKPSTPNFHTVP